MNKEYDPPLIPSDDGYIAPDDPESLIESCCHSQSPEGWWCTQLGGHPMPHTAHGIALNLYAIWDEEITS